MNLFSCIVILGSIENLWQSTIEIKLLRVGSRRKAHKANHRIFVCCLRLTKTYYSKNVRTAVTILCC